MSTRRYSGPGHLPKSCGGFLSRPTWRRPRSAGLAMPARCYTNTNAGLATLVLSITVGIAIEAVAQEPGQRIVRSAGAIQPSGPSDSRGSAPEADRYISPQIARLEMLVGPWKLTETHFSAGGEVIATVEGTERIIWILDRHAIRRVYQSGTDTRTYEAIGTLTWNDEAGKYHGVWFDNVSTGGPVTTKGDWNDETLVVEFTTESRRKDGSVIRHKVVERFEDEKRRVATTYLIDGADLIKRLEVEYERTVPCPPLFRPVIGDVLERRSR